MMNVSRRILLAGLIWFVGIVVSPNIRNAKADTFWIKGQTEPVYGRLVEQSDDKVIVNRTIDGEQFEKVTFLREEVVAMIISHDAQRLESLDPGKLEFYRDLAEELSSQAKDPVARKLAIRLFLIAAANSDGNNDGLRASSLAGLVRLAKTEAEVSRWQTLQFLADNVNEIPLQSSSRVVRPSEDAKSKMLQIVQSLRKGDGLPPGIDDSELEPWSAICRKSELEEISRANRPSTEQLRKLLQIEFQIRNPNPDQPSAQENSWGSLAIMPSQPFAFIPNFENATEFDPHKTVFQNGQWTKPLEN